MQFQVARLAFQAVQQYGVAHGPGGGARNCRMEAAMFARVVMDYGSPSMKIDKSFSKSCTILSCDGQIPKSTLIVLTYKVQWLLGNWGIPYLP